MLQGVGNLMSMTKKKEVIALATNRVPKKLRGIKTLKLKVFPFDDTDNADKYFD